MTELERIKEIQRLIDEEEKKQDPLRRPISWDGAVLLLKAFRVMREISIELMRDNPATNCQYALDQYQTISKDIDGRFEERISKE